MAEMLIRLHNRAYGDIVIIKPDGWNWGIKESPPSFSVIKFEDVAPSSLYQYKDEIVEESGFAGKRKWKINIDDMETSGYSTNKIVSSGLFVVGTSKDIELDDIVAFIYDKKEQKSEKEKKNKIEKKS